MCGEERERFTLTFMLTRVEAKLHLGAPRLLGGEQPGRDGDRERGEGDGSGVACFVSRLRVCVVSRWAFGVRQSARWGERRVCEVRCENRTRPATSQLLALHALPPPIILFDAADTTRGTDDGRGMRRRRHSARGVYLYVSLFALGTPIPSLFALGPPDHALLRRYHISCVQCRSMNTATSAAPSCTDMEALRILLDVRTPITRRRARGGRPNELYLGKWAAWS